MLPGVYISLFSVIASLMGGVLSSFGIFPQFIFNTA